MIPATIPAMFLDVCRRYEGNTSKGAYAKKVGGVWKLTTHDELRNDVECFALGLLHYGVVPGERVGILSENRIEWVTSDFALSVIGAVDVPVFPTLTGKQLEYIYQDCEATCIIVSNAYQLKKVLSIRDAVPSLRTIIVMQSGEYAEGVLTFDAVLEAGAASSSGVDISLRSAVGASPNPTVRREKFESMALRVKPDDLLTLIYTSGTTGNPKGVMLSHSNMTSNIAGALAVIPMNDSDSLLSYLPMCHAYERMSGYYLAFFVGATSYMAESIETVAENLKEVRPTFMTSVPRLFERIRARVFAAVEKESGIKQKLFHWALAVGRRWADGEQGIVLAAQHALADKLVLSKIRARTGGRLRFFVSGGAALSFELGKFFQSIGVRILEGYGLTETSPVIAVNRVDEEELGTVGPPLPNVEVRIAADGEILARGPSIMLGYWRDEEATRATIDPDGWLHTGDIGIINEHGHLQITDRKKHLFISSGGKNIAPNPIESRILESPLIDQMMLIGDAREFVTALIVPDETAARAWATRNNVTSGSWKELATSAELRQALQKDINQLQRDFAKHERIRRFALLDEPFTVENGMMTPTLKIKRKVVEQRYIDLIESLYSTAEIEGP